MAKKKKKDEGLSYLQVPLPQGQGYYRIIINWLGLNKRQDYDAGVLSEATNVCLDEAPYLSVTPTMKEYVTDIGCKKWVSNKGKYSFNPYPYETPLSIHGFENALLVVYEKGDRDAITYCNTVFLDYLHLTNGGLDTALTGLLDDSYAEQKCITQFNAYDNLINSVTSSVITKLIILPDKKTIPKRIQHYGTVGSDLLQNDSKASAEYAGVLLYGETGTSEEESPEYEFFTSVQSRNGDYVWQKLTYPADDGLEYKRKFFAPSTLSTGLSQFPDMDYAVAHQSRLYGVGDGRVFVSGYNDYANWALDTADEYNESNAWCSPAQSNIKADKDFTGIIAFKNHVVCFKKNFVHEIYNTKNPFRLVDVYSEGAIDNRTIQEVNGSLIFVSENNVLVYTGSTPKILGYELGIEQFEYAVAGTDERRYYLYCRGTKDKEEIEGFYVYDTLTGVWTERSIDINPNKDCEKVIGFAHNNRGMFMLGGDGRIYKLDTGEYDSTEWSFETELITRQSSASSSSSAYTSVNIKHIKKLQMLAEIEPTETDNKPYLKIYALYDGEKFDENTSQLVYDSGDKTGVLPVRIKLRKSAHYSVKLHVEGKGMVRLYNMELFMEKGGDLYV